MIGASIAPLHRSDAVSAIVRFGALQTGDQVGDLSSAQPIFQQAQVSDEYALEKIADTFGPQVAASMTYRATSTTQSTDEQPIRYTETSSNIWCGYYVQDSRLNAVRATFNVCKTTTANAISGSWVGLGNSSAGLIQTGYSMREWSPHCYFKCWYELLPAAPVYINGITLHIDDELGATVQRDWNYGANWYFLCIMNQTTGQYFASVFNYVPSPVCGEWIVETPHGYRIGTWNWPQGFWDAYWWDAGNPYTTYRITQGATYYHIKMNTGSPHYEHATAYYDGPTGFHVQKTST